MIDLNSLKEKIQTMLQTANTTTASVDLSSGMTHRVQRVLKVNPQKIPVQVSYYPYVTCYIDTKKIKNKTIAVNQATGKRLADVSVKVIGVVRQFLNADTEVDPADDECEILLESIEQILRNDPTLAGFANWSFPDAVTYHNVQLEEEANIRAGILNLNVSVYY